jgi:hypothetical protein
MSARIPEKDVRDFLAALPGSPFGAADVNIRCGFPRSPTQPNTSLVGIWIDAIERAPAPYYGAAANYRTADIDVKVVSAPEDLDGGWAQARAVREALHTHAPDTYVACLNTLCRYMGRNGESGQHLFAVNFTLTWSA